MKAILGILVAISALVVFSSDSTASGGNIAMGDSYQSVISILGRPNGSMEIGGKRVLVYDRGEVILVEGEVVKIDLVSQEAAALEQSRRSERRAAAIARTTIEDLERQRRGTAVKTAKLGSGYFLAQLAETRLEFWKHFRVQYPRVDVAREIDSALLEISVERSANARDERIYTLEERVRHAEQRSRSQSHAYSPYSSYSRFTRYDNRGRGDSHHRYDENFNQGQSGYLCDSRPFNSITESNRRNSGTTRDANTHHLEVRAQIARQVNRQNRILSLHRSDPLTRSVLLRDAAVGRNDSECRARPPARATPPRSHPTFFAASITR